jgi:hypothetical protein
MKAALLLFLRLKELGQQLLAHRGRRRGGLERLQLRLQLVNELLALVVLLLGLQQVLHLLGLRLAFQVIALQLFLHLVQLGQQQFVFLLQRGVHSGCGGSLGLQGQQLALQLGGLGLGLAFFFCQLLFQLFGLLLLVFGERLFFGQLVFQQFGLLAELGGFFGGLLLQGFGELFFFGQLFF